MVIGGILYASHGIYAGELYIPGRRGGGVTVRGVSAAVLSAAVLAAVVNLAARVLDHYDRRNNETFYKKLGETTKFAFWMLFALSFFMPDKW